MYNHAHTHTYTYAHAHTHTGQALGPLGINMMTFCKQFNERTQMFKVGIPMRVKLTTRTDSTWGFDVLSPPTSWFLKQAAEVKKVCACVRARKYTYTYLCVCRSVLVRASEKE